MLLEMFPSCGSFYFMWYSQLCLAAINYNVEDVGKMWGKETVFCL